MVVAADDGWMQGVGRRGLSIAAVVEKVGAGLMEMRGVGFGCGVDGVVGGAGTAVAAVVGTLGTPALLVLQG